MKLFKLLMLIIVISLQSCETKTKNPSSTETQEILSKSLEEQVVCSNPEESSDSLEVMEMLAWIEADIKNNEDTLRASRMIGLKMFQDSTSSKEEYLPLLSYLYKCECSYEDYSQTTHYDINEMFINFPEKQKEFINLVHKLPGEYQIRIKQSLVQALLGEIYADNEYEPNEVLEIIFKKKFPYLVKVPEISNIVHVDLNREGYYNYYLKETDLQSRNQTE